MRQESGHGRTVLFATHYLEEADAYADRIVFVRAGRIVADGTADDLARRVGSQAEVRWAQDGQRFVHASDDATTFVRELFAQHGEAIEDLEVRRASLEDTYIAMVQQHESGAAGAAGQAAATLAATTAASLTEDPR
jgi:ABC-2 type transport system ATP-binding protein